MRVHVISDLEGVSGVVKAGQTGGGEPMYEEARRLSVTADTWWEAWKAFYF